MQSAAGLGTAMKAGLGRMGAGMGAGMGVGARFLGRGLGTAMGVPMGLGQSFRTGLQAGSQGIAGQGTAGEVPYYLAKPGMESEMPYDPLARPQTGMQAQESGDLDALARMIMGDPAEDLARFAQGIQFHQSPPEWGPMNFNRAAANPFLGPGITGLQGLIRGGFY